MVVDREPPPLLVRETAFSRFKTRLLSSPATLGICVFVLLVAVVISLQAAGGTYHAEFGGYPDEPAHYITSLMVRDYIASLNWSSPLQFAVQYYHYYPKVALGHWPPFFYVVQGLWMLLFSASRTSVRLEVAFTTALLGYSVYAECKRWFASHIWAVLAALLTVCIPLVQQYTDEEMSETLLTLLCFWAVIFFARYLDSERWQDNVFFGIFFSLAVLTKGSGWLLAGVIPIAVLLTRRLRIVLRWKFWIAPAIVGVTCIPWQLFTLHMAEQGWTETSHAGLQYVLFAVGQFSLILLRVAGWPMAILALLGLVATVLAAAFRRSVKSRPTVMFGLIVCTVVFHAIVPAGIEDRKLLIAVPAWVLFIIAGAHWLADQLQVSNGIWKWKQPLMAGAVAVAFGLSAFTIPQQTHYGFEEAARYITSHPALEGDRILVSDNSVGEGLLISEIAMHEKRPGNVLIRGTKVLAEVDWAGKNYHSLYSKPQEVTEAIDKLHINLVVIDTFPGFRDLEHNRLLREALQDSHHFQLITTFSGDSRGGKGKVLIYNVKNRA